MSQIPDHFCPGCGAARRSFPRYPWHFCNDCARGAETRQGKKLRFQNASASGGFEWSDDDGATWHQARGVYCLIARRKVYVTEARFGGIVAQPVTDAEVRHNPGDVPDLTRKIWPQPE